MCGIFLVYSNNKIDNYFEKFQKSLHDLKSRGPDKTQYIKKKNFLIGFTRLSINDLNSGDQPYESEDKRYTILFNGEILNYKNLIDHLLYKKIKLKKYTEIEVILNLYILYHEKFLDHLKGFFSIVIIDHKTSKVFACVDQFSVKPLYYYFDKNLLILTSNLSPLLNNNIINKKYYLPELINFVSIGREISNRTIYEKIYKLRASTYVVFNKNKSKTFSYWSPFLLDKNNIYEKKDYKNIIIDGFDTLINRWKTSDVKLANTRSSGLDSNLLNFFFKKNNVDTRNFLIRESKNHYLKKNENFVNINPSVIEREFNRYIKFNLDPTPLALDSSLSLFALYKDIRKKNFKVCFNGEGADELFGGYDRYIKHLYLIKKRKGDIYKSFLDLYDREVKFADYTLKKGQLSVYNHLLKRIKKIKINSKSNLNKILEFDQLTFIPSLIKRHDSIGMFNSLEVRPPYLDQDFVNLANNLPETEKINKSQKKILRQVALKNFKFKTSKIKLGTPTFFSSIINNEKNIKNFKENIFDGELSKFFDPVKIWEICQKQQNIKINHKKTNHIFLWRIFVLSRIFEQTSN